MRILHPYLGVRVAEEQETWDFLAQVRADHEVIDRKQPDDDGHTLLDFVAEYWGQGDLVILEEDKVPTMENLQEYVDCKLWGCATPYGIRNWATTSIRVWHEQFPYGLGFVKFTLAAQEAVPVSKWDIAKGLGFGPKLGVDRVILAPLLARFGPLHLHEAHPIKHNHNAGPVVP